MRTRPLAIVLGGDAVGLGVARSLHRARIPAVAVALDPWDPVRFSRCARTVVVPQAARLEKAILETLERLPGDPPSVLIPSSDFFAHFVARHRECLESYFRILGPPLDVVETVLDKGRDGAVLARAMIPLPRTVTWLPPEPEALLRTVDLPLIVKPRTYVDKREIGWRNVVLRSREHVAEFYQKLSHLFDRVVVQEIIPGDDTALWECIALFDERSELVSAFTFRKRRTVPAHFGQTSYGVSERNETVIALTARIGKALGWTGPADVDLKYDARDGTYRYLELNPRFGLCNHLAAASGVNPVADAYHLACGAPVPARPPQRDGVTFFAVLEDVGGRLYDGDSWLRILGGVIAALATRPVGSYFAWRDPLPGPTAALKLVVRLIQRLRSGQLGSIFTKDYGRAPAPEVEAEEGRKAGRETLAGALAP